ncbi:reverse transcriptase [Gossypium australe]|uniref:Reverse transcriptase n=1 Tax=Gossypium australe TaxID=47621 RepID=A0A5B6W026_9ROSI|nr:reverse transcriptase [Gossypium australe]
MACFLLPKSSCMELENIMNSFWWNKTNGKRGMHWCDWKSLSAIKEKGGMGFRDLNFFNIALLAKQGWRLLHNPNSLLARTLKAKYYKKSNFLKSKLGNLPSFTWKSLWATKGLLLKGLGWRIGDGQNVFIWDDKWVPGNEMFSCQNSTQNSSLVKVADLIDTSTRKWNEELVLNTFTERDAERILCIPLEYSVRSGHRVLSHVGQTQIQNNVKQFYKRLWSLELPSKIKITVWRSMRNYLPNFSNLHYRKIMGSVNCRRCQAETETREHLFRNCPVTKETWERLEVKKLLSSPNGLKVFLNTTFWVCVGDLCAHYGKFGHLETNSFMRAKCDQGPKLKILLQII